MAFTLVPVVTAGIQTQGFTPIRPVLARASTSLIWAAYFDPTYQFIKVKRSEDLGLTWVFEETVVDFGAPTAGMPLILTLDANDQPVVCWIDATDANFVIRLGSPSLGTWTPKTPIPVASQEVGASLMADEFLRWHFIHVRTSGGFDQMVHVVSDDGMDNWAEHDTVDFGDNTGLLPMQEKASSAAVMDDSGNIYFVGCGGDLAADTLYAVHFAKYDHGLDSWTSEEAWIVGSNQEDKGVAASITIATDARVHVVVHYQDQSALDGVYQVQYSRRSLLGVWLGTEIPYAGPAATDQFGIVGFHSHPFDSKPYVVVYGLGWGTNPGVVNVVYTTRVAEFAWTLPASATDTANAWLALAILDARNFSIGSQFYGDTLLGVAGLAIDATGSLNYFYSDDAAYDLLPGLPTTPSPTTAPPTTPAPSTAAPTTPAPTTPGPTTPAPSTPTPTTADHTAFPFICCGRRFVAARREVVIRAWLEDFDHQLLDFPLSKANSRATLFSEEGQVGDVASEFDDPIGSHVLLFRMPVGLLLPGHAYFLRLQVVGEDDTDYGTAEFALGTT